MNLLCPPICMETTRRLIWRTKCQSKRWEKYNNEFLRNQASNICEISTYDREIILLFKTCFHCLKTFPVNSKFQFFSRSLAGKKQLRKSWKLFFKFVDKLFFRSHAILEQFLLGIFLKSMMSLFKAIFIQELQNFQRSW